MVKKLIIVCICILGYVFLPTTIFLAIGMMPTLAAFTIDRSVGKSKTICVGFMNFAGCFPFVLQLWTDYGQPTIENALTLIADVQNIIIVYLLAAGGYAIDVAVTGITATLIIQRLNSRLEHVKDKQKKLEEEWGEKVTGKYVLDEFGFPLENAQQRTKL